jgi:nucleoside-diphosphate-sugar epimerase
MRIVVVGATGNVGTSLVTALSRDERVGSIVGIARRLPRWTPDKTTWVEADISTDDLAPHFAGADCVVHLAWLIQPSRDMRALRATNVVGSRNVFDAAARAGVGSLVYGSSVGAYAPGPKDRPVDETWPTTGVPTSFYSNHKAETESMLDDFEQANPGVRVVRIRPGLIFKREAASGVRRLFLGPLVPRVAFRKGVVALVPRHPSLKFQAVHSYDVGEAYRLAVLGDVRGAFNIAAPPVLSSERLAELFDARLVPTPGPVLRLLAAAAWRMRLDPTPEGWVDLGLRSPLMDTTRAETVLGWAPRYSSVEALEELFGGLRDEAGFETPPLSPSTGGPFRLKELATGIGKRSGVS